MKQLLMTEKIEMQVETKIDEGKITLETSLISGGIKKSFGLRTMDLQEEAIRKALIKLGWTPPKEEGA